MTREPISTAPKDGTRITVGHSKAPGGDTTGEWNEAEQQWDCDSWFILPNMMLVTQPDYWVKP